MARVTINEEILGDIADSIRDKTETTGSIAPADMATMISGISSGSVIVYDGVSTTTPTTDCKEMTFENPLDSEPSYIMIIATNINDIIGKSSYKIIMVDSAITTSATACVATGNNKAVRNGNASGFTIIKDENTVAVSFTNSTYNFMGGVEYSCLMWK